METINKVLEKFSNKEKGDLIAILQQVQNQEGYISPLAVKEISGYLHISRSETYGVATFYSQFKFNPPGRHSIKMCLGTACHVQGGDFILKALEREIDISPGETTQDGRFDLERVACLGCCALAPVIMIDGDIHSRMSVVKLKQVLSRYE